MNAVGLAAGGMDVSMPGLFHPWMQATIKVKYRVRR
jgi:hypothetical protein